MNAIETEQVNTQSNRKAYQTSQVKRLGLKQAGRKIAVAAVTAGVALGSFRFFAHSETVAAPAQLAPVTVSAPLTRDLDQRLQFLGQFSAVEQVELRPQVGGTLTEIHFKDGDFVTKGDPLFTIDATPYEIKLAQATAQLEGAKARLTLANDELERAKVLKRTDAGTTQNVQQRVAEQLAAEASLGEAKAMVRDAQFDLDRCRITAPFSGRIGSHAVSVGNLVAGSRAGGGATTLLTTIVSLDPIYLNFDMSEQDYLAFAKQRELHKGGLADKISVSLSDETTFDHQGTLDFIDNRIDRSSGTIHARATLPNKDHLLTPGSFGRARLSITAPEQTLLVSDASVLPDLSDHIVLTVDSSGSVTPKKVQLGEIRGGLRIIRSGLTANDRVIIDGIMMASPGSKVSPTETAIAFKNEQN